MIASCRHCHQDYWRYRTDHPPSGFCSWPCKEMGASGKKTAPRKTGEIRDELRLHRREEHGNPSGLNWYECNRCDELEEEYAQALAYSAILTAAIEGPPRKEQHAL
jgi:hypothetical protein